MFRTIMLMPFEIDDQALYIFFNRYSNYFKFLCFILLLSMFWLFCQINDLLLSLIISVYFFYFSGVLRTELILDWSFLIYLISLMDLFFSYFFLSVIYAACLGMYDILINLNVRNNTWIYLDRHLILYNLQIQISIFGNLDGMNFLNCGIWI